MKRVMIGIFSVALVLGLALSYGCSKPTAPPAKVENPTPPAAAQAPAAAPAPTTTTPPPTAAAPAPTAAAPAAPAATGDVKKYTIKTDESSIVWNATVPIGTREGGWSLFEGTVEIAGTDISTIKTSVTVDMKSAYADHPAITEKLKGDEHFFLPGKYPTSTFKSTSVKASADGFDVTGDLTIRDKTKTITFPAKIAIDGANIKVTSEFQLNRNDFDIKYQSTVGDYAIQDMCTVKLDILCVPAV